MAANPARHSFLAAPHLLSDGATRARLWEGRATRTMASPFARFEREARHDW
jgi:hypothetical protein